MDPWFNKKFCDRCHKSLADGFSVSRFNTQALCFTALKRSVSIRITRKRWMPSLRHSAPAIGTLLVSDGPEKTGG